MHAVLVEKMSFINLCLKCTKYVLSSYRKDLSTIRPLNSVPRGSFIYSILGIKLGTPGEIFLKLELPQFGDLSLSAVAYFVYNVLVGAPG